MAKAVHLTSAQETQILRAAYALPSAERELLRQRVLEKLEAAPEIGDGAVYRVCRPIQRELFQPPPDVSQGPRVFQKLR
jgi:hypothetical protein